MTADAGEYQGDGQDGPGSNSEYAWKRRQEKAVKDAERERDAAKREAAFLRAGIDPDQGGIASYFVKGYDGDLSREAIVAAAAEAGLIQAPPPSPEKQARAAEVAVTAEVAGYSSNAAAAPTQDEAQRAAMEEAYRTGGVDGLAAFMRSQGIPQVEV